MNYVLEVNGLKKAYKQKQVLQDVTFNVYEGCISGFIGVNGVGKTTTIKMLLGLVKPDAGDIKIFGMDLKQNQRKIKERIGIVFDNGYLYDDLTIKDMAKIISSAYKSWDQKVFQDYMDRFSLNQKEYIKNLSKGMRMKCALAYALSHHADLLIMDEPTSGLDPQVRRQILQIIQEFVEEEGKSVFFSTHITNDLERCVDDVIMLQEGKVLFQEEKDRLLESHAFVKGNKNWLDQENESLFIELNQKGFHFEGLTNQKEKVKKRMPQALFEKPNIEEIMIAYSKK
ncbi:MAG TPA: ABC transporter ATP-binding protein [Candidatus Scybalomonas excrementigallinarum]|nr:ABC transporter ATP-binding protein [Candidatus Scybalomonas excrementigallinarum]